MDIFNCDPKWPICLFDFTYKNKVPNHLCFKVGGDLTDLIKDNYFEAADCPPNRTSDKEKLNFDKMTEQDLLIERNNHLCN